PKTKASETPFASRSSTGTGKRSARSEAPRNAARPARTVTLCVAIPKERAAATTVASPATQTGMTTGKRLRRAAADSLIARPLPLEEVGEIERAERRRNGEQRGHDQQKAKTWPPLQHSEPPSLSSMADEAILSCAEAEAITRTGE